MIIQKRLNNNVVYVSEGEQEAIVIGKGIGFQVYSGDKVNKSLIEKTFVSVEGMSLSQLTILMDDISIEEIKLAEEIISLGMCELNKQLNSNLLFPLMDHLNFAFKRHSDNMTIISPIHWEVKRFYPKEVKIGIMALELIKQRMGIDLPEAEAVFIALHFVNAQYDNESIASTIEYTELINSLMRIVKYHFQIELDEESFVFNRFLIHLRYYLMRCKNGDIFEVKSPDLLETVMIKFAKELACVNKITEYLYKCYGWKTPDEEKMYLILHINCLISRIG